MFNTCFNNISNLELFIKLWGAMKWSLKMYQKVDPKI